MCYVKQGKEVTSEEDIRNLITGIILRQKNAYRKEDVLATVLAYLKDATVKVEEENVSKLLDDGLDILGRNGEVSCWNGVYKTSDIN